MKINIEWRHWFDTNYKSLYKKDIEKLNCVKNKMKKRNKIILSLFFTFFIVNNANAFDCGIRKETVKGQKDTYYIGNGSSYNTGDSALAKKQLLCLSQLDNNHNYILTADVDFSKDDGLGNVEFDIIPEFSDEGESKILSNLSVKVIKNNLDWNLDGKVDKDDENGWEPFSSKESGKSFFGDFDGQNHKITNLYSINKQDSGFFGKISGDVKNIVFENAWIEGSSNIGILSATAGSSSNIYNIVASGGVYSSGGFTTTGGLIGRAGKAKLQDIKMNMYIFGKGSDVGGLVGRMYDGGSLENIYVKGYISGSFDIMGGISGSINADIQNSFSNSNIYNERKMYSDYHNTKTGSLIGVTYTGKITNSYGISRLYNAIGNKKQDYHSLYCSVGKNKNCAIDYEKERIKRFTWNKQEWDKIEKEYSNNLNTLNKEVKLDCPRIISNMDTNLDFFLIGGAKSDKVRGKKELLCLSQNQYINKNLLSRKYMLTTDIDFYEDDGFGKIDIEVIPKFSYKNKTKFLSNIEYNIIENSIDWNGDGNVDDEKGWNPLGYPSFIGVFDGNNHIINGIYINNNESLFSTGFFSEIEGATVKNLILTNMFIKSQGVTGGLIGWSKGRKKDYNEIKSKITNCAIDANIMIERGDYTGIIAGRSRNTIISNSKIKGHVIGQAGIGGAVGLLERHSKIYNFDSFVFLKGTRSIGGLISCASRNASIEKTASYGNIYGRKNVGGLVGGEFCDPNIDRAYFKGNVYGSENVGGAIGRTSSQGNLRNLKIDANVYGTNKVGGIIGDMSGYRGVVLKNSYVSGTVNGRKNVGGLVGFYYGSGKMLSEWDDSFIENSYSLSKVEGNNKKNVSGLVGSLKRKLSFFSGKLRIKNNNKCEYINGKNKICSDKNASIINSKWDSSIWEDLGTPMPRLKED